MPNRYKRAPIVEAVFEFAPTSVPKWYDGTTRQILGEVGAAYPQTDDVKVVSRSIKLGPSGVSEQSPPREITRTRMWNSGKTRMFQFGRDLCAFNALKPYTSYDEYGPAMRPLVEEYVRRTRAPSVLFLGQRYLNHILLPDTAANPSEFFHVYPKLANRPHGPFAMQVQVGEVVQGTTILSLNFQGLDAGTRPRYLLDLYVRTKDSPEIAFEWEEMQAWQDAAHQSIIRGFEDAITDKCRELFEPMGTSDHV